MDFAGSAFWLAVLEIIAIDVVLSGDNAVVIALACRNLGEEQRLKGIFWGVAGAIGLRVLLTTFAAGLFGYPYVKLLGGLLLLWIGIKLLLPGGDDPEVAAAEHLWAAIRTIVAADFVMSLDNIVAVAAAARDHIGLLIFGLLVSIPLIVWSSQLIMGLMDRYPSAVVFGAALLGYVAGDMVAGDEILHGRLSTLIPAPEPVTGLLGAVLVVAFGRWLAGHIASRQSARPDPEEI